MRHIIGPDRMLPLPGILACALLACGCTFLPGCGGDDHAAHEHEEEHAGHEHATTPESPQIESPAAEPGAVVGGLTPYPLAYCVVSGEKLGSMGDPAVLEHEGRQIKFCCTDCAKEFRKDPEKYLAMIDKAVQEGATAAPSGGAPEDHEHEAHDHG